MAFFSKAGNILRQISQKHMNQEIAAYKPSILQAIRCMSSSKVFVGGLSYGTDDTSLREAFSDYGDVAEARVIQDRETGRSRGFGFVTYASEEAASAAIQALDGQELHGRRVRVNYANDRPRSFGGGGGGGYGDGGYSRNTYGEQGGGGRYGGNTYGQGYGNSYGTQGNGGYNAGVDGFTGVDNYASPGGDTGYGGYNAANASPEGGLDEQLGNGNSGEEPAGGGEFRDDDGDFANRRG